FSLDSTVPFLSALCEGHVHRWLCCLSHLFSHCHCHPLSVSVSFFYIAYDYTATQLNSLYLTISLSHCRSVSVCVCVCVCVCVSGVCVNVVACVGKCVKRKLLLGSSDITYKQMTTSWPSQEIIFSTRSVWFLKVGCL